MTTRRHLYLGRRATLLDLLALAGLVAGAALATSCTSSRSTETTTMKKRILIAMTSHAEKGSTGEKTGAYLAEIAHPYAVFEKAGFDVDFASVRGGQVPLDGVDRNDPLALPFIDGPLAGRLRDSISQASVDPERYDAIFFAGGHGAMWDFPDAEAFARAAARIYERGGVVSAVCHGPAALVNLKLSSGAYLVAGKDVSAFTNEEERAVKLEGVVPFLLEQRLVERGATFKPAAKWQKQVVVSERLVTGQNPASAAGVAEAVVALLA